MDAIELLTQQHKEAMELMEKIEESEDPKQGRRLFEELKADLELHEELEEKILYPKMKAEEEWREDTLEAYQEHHVMDLLLREISNLSEGSQDFKPKLKVLKENVKHHAEEEEEGKLFPEIREKWGAERIQELGAEMEQMAKERKGSQRKAA